MKQFKMMEQRQAIKYAGDGGQALHIHPFTNGHFLFKRYREAAHLFDQDLDRLIKTVKKLGVRRIKVEHQGEPIQHIDLCAGPLEKAKLACVADEIEYTVFKPRFAYVFAGNDAQAREWAIENHRPKLTWTYLDDVSKIMGARDADVYLVGTFSSRRDFSEMYERILVLNSLNRITLHGVV